MRASERAPCFGCGFLSRYPAVLIDNERESVETMIPYNIAVVTVECLHALLLR